MTEQNKNFFASEMESDFFTLCEESLMATITGKLPTKIEKFKETIIAEIQMIKNLKVYEEKNIKKRTYVIRAKQVLHEKKATSLFSAKLKVKLVTRGFIQRYSVNYEEIHALVAKIASMRAFFAICATKGWKIHQIDVNNVYLNDEIDIERIYIK